MYMHTHMHNTKPLTVMMMFVIEMVVRIHSVMIAGMRAGAVIVSRRICAALFYHLC